MKFEFTYFYSYYSNTYATCLNHTFLSLHIVQSLNAINDIGISLDTKIVLLYSPNHVVHTNDALRLLFLVHDRRLCHHPAVAAGPGEKPVPKGFGLSLADGCNGNGGEKENFVITLRAHTNTLHTILNGNVATNVL